MNSRANRPVVPSRTGSSRFRRKLGCVTNGLLLHQLLPKTLESAALSPDSSLFLFGCQMLFECQFPDNGETVFGFLGGGFGRRRNRCPRHDAEAHDGRRDDHKIDGHCA